MQEVPVVPADAVAAGQVTLVVVPIVPFPGPVVVVVLVAVVLNFLVVLAVLVVAVPRAAPTVVVAVVVLLAAVAQLFQVLYLGCHSRAHWPVVVAVVRASLVSLILVVVAVPRAVVVPAVVSISLLLVLPFSFVH